MPDCILCTIFSVPCDSFVMYSNGENSPPPPNLTDCVPLKKPLFEAMKRLCCFKTNFLQYVIDLARKPKYVTKNVQ